jgi:DNA repair exonuclease SbcCD ATPase subunit
MVRMTPEAYETVKENIKALSDGTALYEAISDAREGIKQYSEEANINRLKAIDTEVEKRTKRYRSERDEARASERTVREENTTLREEIASVRENAKAISGTFEEYRRKNDILEHKLEGVKDILNRTKQERDDLSDALDKKDDSIREWFFQSLQRIVPERFQKIKESIDWDWDKTSRFNTFEYFYRKGVEEDMKEYGAVMNDTEKYGKEADKVAWEYVRDYRKHGIREIYGKIEAWCHERGIRIPTRNHQKQRTNEWER